MTGLHACDIADIPGAPAKTVMRAIRGITSADLNPSLLIAPAGPDCTLLNVHYYLRCLQDFARRHYKCRVGPLGFTMRGEIISFPDGMPGDVGLLLKW
jgi:hypothetical protein